MPVIFCLGSDFTSLEIMLISLQFFENRFLITYSCKEDKMKMLVVMTMMEVIGRMMKAKNYKNSPCQALF